MSIAIADAASSKCRPVLRGHAGAIAAAHPLAVAAGQEILTAGGTAADAAIAAQAVLCVIAPDACGLGGDMLAIVRAPGVEPVALNGTGAAPSAPTGLPANDAGSITVPGIVDAWMRLSEGWGRLDLSVVLRPAVRLARGGIRVTPTLAGAVAAQRGRLIAGGAEDWADMLRRPGALVVQERLALLLDAIGRDGAGAFYTGPHAEAIARAVQRHGGTLAAGDLAAHATIVRAPIETGFAGVRVSAQPPMAQGILLTMALRALEKLGPLPKTIASHAAIELTEATFAYRDDVAEGEALLSRDLTVDLTRAARRGGPRAYLHTAGVATADAGGLVVSSLLSVFDDFGSCIFVPELGITLNNRAAGFTAGRNAPAPGKRPVHTLAPALMTDGSDILALATPGADGQVQTLLQVIAALIRDGQDLAAAIDGPRWRSENGALLIEASHPERDALASLGHDLRVLPDGDNRFGAIVCAGCIDGTPVAAADWRRETWAGVV